MSRIMLISEARSARLRRLVRASTLWRVRLTAMATAACMLLASTSRRCRRRSRKASTDSVQVAEPFTLDVTVTAPVGAKVTFPAIADKIGDFDVRDSQDVFDVPADDARTWTRHLTLESITTGDLQIPPIDVQVNEGGKATLVPSQPVTIRVASVLEDRSDPTKYRDIQSVVDVDVPVVRSNTWVWWTLGGAAGVTSACDRWNGSLTTRWLADASRLGH